jgi:ubiquinone/menaquinone biosynthesis C-methylase UbiE
MRIKSGNKVKRMKNYQKTEREKRDNGALTYDKWLRSNKGPLFDVYERELFVKLVKERAPYSVIDVGSGTGRMTEALAPLAKRVVGLDFSSQSLKVLLSRNIDNCSALCASGASLPVKNESFDLAVSCQVLPLMQLEELLMTLEEIRRILKRNGVFIFSAYNYDYWRYHGIIDMGEIGGSYRKHFSPGYVHHLARKSNFGVKQLGYYKSLPLRLFRRKGWIAADRIICATPYVRRIASAYLVSVLEKEDHHGRC